MIGFHYDNGKEKGYKTYKFCGAFGVWFGCLVLASSNEPRLYYRLCTGMVHQRQYRVLEESPENICKNNTIEDHDGMARDKHQYGRHDDLCNSLPHVNSAPKSSHSFANVWSYNHLQWGMEIRQHRYVGIGIGIMLVWAYKFHANQGIHSGHFLVFSTLWQLGCAIHEANHGLGSTDRRRTTTTLSGCPRMRDQRAILDSSYAPIGMDHDFELTSYKVFMQSFPSDQCIQILYTSLIASINCELPLHCGVPYYYKITSSYFGMSTGLCLGVGFHGIEPMLASLYVPVHPEYVQPTMFFWVLEQDGKYYIASDDYVVTLPVYKDGMLVFDPNLLHQKNGYYCIPKLLTHTSPFIKGPYKKDQAIYYARYMPGGANAPSEYDLCLNNTYCFIDNQLHIGAYGIVDCEPMTQTTRLLPGWTSISAVVSYAVLALVHAISYVVIRAYHLLAHTILHQTTIFNLVAIFYMYTRYSTIEIKTRVVVAILTTLVIESYIAPM